MKILVVSNVGYIGGAESVLVDLIRADKTNEYFVLTPRGQLSHYLDSMGINFSSVGPNELRRDRVTPMLFFRMPIIFLKGILGVFWAHRKFDADIIYANSLRSGVYCLFSSIIIRSPMVWHIHDINETHMWTMVMRFISKINMKIIIVAVSNAVMNSGALLVVPNQVKRLVYNGIDTKKEYYINENQIGTSFHGFSILMYGRIVPWKGFHVLIKAISHLDNLDRECVMCTIIGTVLEKDRLYFEELKSLAEELGVSKLVQFLDGVPREEIPRILENFDIVVHASTLPDPLPTVLIESMAMGRIVIASDVGGVREIIEDGVDGYIFAANDACSLSEAICKAKDALQNQNSNHKIGLRARKKIEDRFSIESKVASLNVIYSELSLLD